MDLSHPSIEAASSFIQKSVDADSTKEKNLCWRVPTRGLYAMYLKWVPRNTITPAVSVEEFWEIIRLIYPFVQIVGQKGNRAFTGMRYKK